MDGRDWRHTLMAFLSTQACESASSVEKTIPGQSMIVTLEFSCTCTFQKTWLEGLALGGVPSQPNVHSDHGPQFMT